MPSSEGVPSGTLRNPIVIQALPVPPVRNSDGSEKRTPDQWQLFCNARASIDDSGGREFWAAKQVNADLTHEVKIRWRKGITPGMRILFHDYNQDLDRYFDIRGIVNPNDQIRRILLLHCRELIGRQSVT